MTLLTQRLETTENSAIARAMRPVIRENLRRLPIVLPISIEDYAKSQHIAVVSNPHLPQNIGALSRWIAGHQTVEVSPSLLPDQYRFALAHEIIGHGWFHQKALQAKGHSDWSHELLADIYEAEASTAAIEYLVPYCWLEAQFGMKHTLLPLAAGEIMLWALTDADTWSQQLAVDPIVLGQHLIDIGLAAKNDGPLWRQYATIHPAQRHTWALDTLTKDYPHLLKNSEVS